jgi:hypothetical protein
VRDAHGGREEDAATRHPELAGEDEVLGGTNLDERAESLVRRAPHHQVARQREPHRPAWRLVQELAEHQQLLGSADGDAGVGVVDRAADEVVARLGAAHDLVDPVRRRVGVAVDEGQDVPARGGDADRARACRQRPLGQLDGARLRQGRGRDRARVVLPGVHDDDLEQVAGLLCRQRRQAAAHRGR